MLTGRYGDTTGRPYIEGRLLLPRLGLSANVSFLIDTGADTTTLMPLDGTSQGVDYDDLRNPTQCAGFGGKNIGFREYGLVAFSDGIAVFMYRSRFMLVKPKRGIMTIPSVLGRDILNRMIVTFDFSNKRIELHNHESDYIAAVTPDNI